MPNPKIVSRYRSWSLIGASLGALSGLAALTGWILGNDILKGGFIENITMKTNTAVCLILIGLATLLLWSEPRACWRTVIGRFLGLIVAVVGLATLCEHLLHVDLGIDQILFREGAGATSTASPNRMGPTASTCLLLLGTALVLFDRRTRGGRASYQYITLGALVMPMISVLGYLYRAHQLYGIAQLTGIALQTAATLLVLGSAMLLARPVSGFMRRLSGKDSGSLLVRRLLPWALVLPVTMNTLRVIGEQTGLYEPEFGRTILSFGFMAAFAVLVWWTGGIVSRQESAVDAEREEIRERLMVGLEEADRRKNRFLATLAHELRNPLAPVRNAVHLLRVRGNPDRDVTWAHAVIDRQVDHLTRLIEDLMDVSRISYGKLELRKERVALAEAVAGAIESSRHVIDANRHRLEVSLPEEPIALRADPVRLAQIFTNLLTNAAKYTPPGGTIALSARREGSDVVVTVADNGVGLSAEQLPHLFEMFFQTQDGQERTQGGLGIGLALVHHLVELHGGSVTAASEGPGRGSQFHVRLPMSADHAPADAAVLPSSPPASLRGRRVLVVDDNRDATLSLVQLLEIAGASTRRAFDGEEAMQIIDRNEFDVALLDIGLPKMNGHDLARAIRTRDWGKRAVVIALTGWGQDGDRLLSREAGFDHHLVKPVNPGALLSLLEERAAKLSAERAASER